MVVVAVELFEGPPRAKIYRRIKKIGLDDFLEKSKSVSTNSAHIVDRADNIFSDIISDAMLRQHNKIHMYTCSDSRPNGESPKGLIRSLTQCFVYSFSQVILTMKGIVDYRSDSFISHS